MHFRMIAGAFLITALTGSAQAASESACATDTTLKVCVVSASLTGEKYPGSAHVWVSITFEITNLTDYPIQVAWIEGSSFDPKDAPSLSDQISPPQVSGTGKCDPQFCANNSMIGGGEPSTFAPKLPMRVHVTYMSTYPMQALPLLEMASTASFTGRLFVRERGKARFVPIPVREFSFGNGFAR